MLTGGGNAAGVGSGEAQNKTRTSGYRHGTKSLSEKDTKWELKKDTKWELEKAGRYKTPDEEA